MLLPVRGSLEPPWLSVPVFDNKIHVDEEVTFS